MVGPEDVDETLQEEITDECSKYEILREIFFLRLISRFSVVKFQVWCRGESHHLSRKTVRR